MEAAGVSGVAALGAYASAEEAQKAMGLAFKKSNLYCEIKNCYGGGDGTWLVIEAGPYQDRNGHFRSQDISLKVVSQEYVFRNGSFTSYYHDKYHSKSGLQCTASCPYC